MYKITSFGEKFWIIDLNLHGIFLFHCVYSYSTYVHNFQGGDEYTYCMVSQQKNGLLGRGLVVLSPPATLETGTVGREIESRQGRGWSLLKRKGGRTMAMWRVSRECPFLSARERQMASFKSQFSSDSFFRLTQLGSIL
jgi:hypothetical protein